jgi:uncharacterized membrane protein YfcA
VDESLSLGLLLILVPLVFLVAGAYASVGLGGGTGYLAVMTLAGLPAAGMAPTALLLNLVVTGAALVRFGLAGRLQWRLFLPFLLPAIPAAFLGGLVTADRRIFLAVLAVTLSVAALAMLRYAPKIGEQGQPPARARLLLVAIPAGAVIGFLSGFLGIGGGVFLGPLILFLGWAGHRETAAMNSALILVISGVALAAHGLKGGVPLMMIVPLAVAALLGGLAGATFAEKKLSARAFQRIFALIILVAAFKAGYDAFFL